jgi:hypothetical protein
MIKHQRKMYCWEFIFLGAGQDAIQTSFGIASTNAVQFDETPQGVCTAFSAIRTSSAAYRGGDAHYARHLKKASKKKV